MSAIKVCGHCVVKDAELKASNDYIDQLEKGLIGMAGTLRDFFEFMMPDIKTYLPGKVAEMEQCVETMKTIKSQIEKENQKRNETRT